MLDESLPREFSFDSDQSDSDGSVPDNDRYKSSKCRITAISTVQVLCFFPIHDTMAFCKTRILIKVHRFSCGPCFSREFHIIHALRRVSFIGYIVIVSVN